MDRLKVLVGLGVALGLGSVAWRPAEGEDPAMGDAVGTAALNAQLRFGTDIGGRFVDLPAESDASSGRERDAERAYLDAMAKLIQVTLDHPGTDAAGRARCVLDAAENALRERAAYVESPPVFSFTFPVQR